MAAIGGVGRSSCFWARRAALEAITAFQLDQGVVSDISPPHRPASNFSDSL
jgi:hypothetical protein